MGKAEAVYYAGLFVGMILGVLALRAIGLRGIVLTVAAVLCGAGVGYLADRAYHSRRRRW